MGNSGDGADDLAFANQDASAELADQGLGVVEQILEVTQAQLLTISGHQPTLRLDDVHSAGGATSREVVGSDGAVTASDRGTSASSGLLEAGRQGGADVLETVVAEQRHSDVVLNLRRAEDDAGVPTVAPHNDSRDIEGIDKVIDLSTRDRSG